MSSSLNGTGVTFSNGSTQSVAWPGNTGTVTSITAGSGLTGGTITATGTIAVDTSTYAIGTYVFGRPKNITNYSVGNTVAGTSLWATTGDWDQGNSNFYYGSSSNQASVSSTLVNTGTWKCLGNTGVYYEQCRSFYVSTLWVRIS